MLGGVCAGLARRWQVDPNLVRIALVVLVFFGGLGLAAYGAGLLLIPRDGTRELPVRRFLPFTRSWSTPAVVAATIGAAVLLLGLNGSSGIGLGPVAVIFAVWFFGFRNRATTPPVAQRPEPTPFERAADAWRVRLAEQQTPGYEQVPVPAAAELRWEQPYTAPASDLMVQDNDPPAVVVERHRRRGLWWLALALSGVGVLVVSILGVLLGLPTSALAYTAAVLAALGLTLVLSARAGRPPLLLPATLVVAVATGALLVPSGMSVPAVGSLERSYAAVGELPAAVEYSAGDVDLDLSGLQLVADRDLAIHVGAGSVNLRLPRDVATEVTWRVRAGGAVLPDGTNREGFDLADTTDFPAARPGAPTLRITVSVDLGDLEVRR